jgi:hypothetical protein
VAFESIRFSLVAGLAPTGLVGAGCQQEFLNVRLHQMESHIPIKLLASLVQHEARTAFDSHLVGVLVVPSQACKGGATVNAGFNGADVGAKPLGDLALCIPMGNVPTISKKRAANAPHHLLEYARCGLTACNSGLALPLLDRCHEQMRLAEVDGRVFNQISG